MIQRVLIHGTNMSTRELCLWAAQVLNEQDVRLMFGQVQGEVPGSPVFAMALAPQSRHLEVQLICDQCVVFLSVLSMSMMSLRCQLLPFLSKMTPLICLQHFTAFLRRLVCRLPEEGPVHCWHFGQMLGTQLDKRLLYGRHRSAVPLRDGSLPRHLTIEKTRR